MENTAPQPLWRSVVGDTEPWRRGRVFLIAFAILSALNQTFICAVLILGGFIEQTFLVAIYATVFWLTFYFIWIGVHWVRWVQGGFSALSGFALCIWSLEAGSGALFINGLYLLAVGSYLALAPAIYFFAQRQRETRDWKTAIAIAAVFLLLLVSLLSGIYGLFLYRTRMQAEARDFADAAFARVFAQHDTYFLLDHATPRLRAPPFGCGYLTKFLQQATVRAGDVRHIKPATGLVRLRYAFPARLYAEGEMVTNGLCDRGRVIMRMRMGGYPGNWLIDGIVWTITGPNASETP